jgi:hypothetical protein
MIVETQAKWLFRINAVTNWSLSIGPILAPAAVAVWYGGPEPNYPSIVRLWAGLVFMFGLMFWDTSRDVVAKRHLIRYNWIEKTITATAITVGYFGGDVPGRLMTLIVLTNWLWIPAVLYYDLAVRRLARDSRPLSVVAAPAAA